jgi:NIPSNAP
MKRRELLAGLAGSTLLAAENQTTQNQAATVPSTFLEIKTWRLHNSAENQAVRLADYLENGLGPALARGGSKLAGAFSNVIGPDGPYYVTVTEHASLGGMQAALAKLTADEAHQQELQKLSADPGLPFVRVESSLLRSFDGMPAAAVSDPADKRPPRIFELRMYESQSFLTLARKVGMFNHGEMQIFQRLGMRPVFFGETIVGPKQPNLMYMLSYDDMDAHDRLWHDFVTDPAWKKLSAQPQLKDAEIVSNISNVILRPLTFSAIR